jgi:hypothetical protein
MGDNVNVTVNQTVETIVVNPSIIDEVIDIVLTPTIEQVQITSTPHLHVVNVTTTNFIPANHDLTEFTNENADPFVRQSDVPTPTPDASTTQRGLVNIGTQSFKGNKIIVGESSTIGNVLELKNLANTSLFSVSNSGNVGIGMTSPGSLLHLYAFFNPKLTLQGGSGNFINLFAGQSLSVFQFNSSKNFGITAAATIGDGGVANYSQVTFGATRNTAFGDMGFNPTDNGYRVDIQTAGSNGSLRVATGNSIFLGKVGIGTTTPTARLSIVGYGSTSSTIALDVKNNAGTKLFEILDDGSVRINVAGNGLIVPTPDGLHQYKIAIDNSGNLTSTLI